ncbi:MAG: biliverdin-producing heme oxygenase [Pseudomonadota bacterium]
MRRTLREKTARSHARVDAAYSQLDLADEADFARFLQAHHLAYRHLQSLFAEQSDLNLAEIVLLLERDLTEMRAPVLRADQASLPSPDNRLGCLYVLAGSHFGKRVLLKRWSRSSCAAVKRAGHYLNSDLLAAAWPGVVEQLAGIPDGALWNYVIVNSADRTFQLFYEALQFVIGVEKGAYA